MEKELEQSSFQKLLEEKLAARDKKLKEEKSASPEKPSCEDNTECEMCGS